MSSSKQMMDCLLCSTHLCDCCLVTRDHASSRVQSGGNLAYRVRVLILGRLAHRGQRALIQTRDQHSALRLASAGDPADRLGP